MTPAKIALPAVLVALFMSSAQARQGGDFDWATCRGFRAFAIDYLDYDWKLNAVAGRQ